MVLVHGGATASGQKHRLGLHKHILPTAHVDHEHARQGLTIYRLDQLDRAVLLEPVDAARPDLFGQAVDDFNAGKVSLVHRAVEGLTGKGFLMDGAVRVAIKKAAQLVLEFADTLHCGGHQGPGQVLIGQPLAALDRVHEVPLDRVTLGQGHVVAALHHARAARFAKKAFDCHCDLQLRRRLVGMQGGEQPCPTRTQDQDVGLYAAHCRHGRHTCTPIEARTCARRAAVSA